MIIIKYAVHCVQKRSFVGMSKIKDKTENIDGDYSLNGTNVKE